MNDNKYISKNVKETTLLNRCLIKLLYSKIIIKIKITSTFINIDQTSYKLKKVGIKITYGIALSLTSCLGLMGRAVFLLVLVMLEVIITAESTTFVCNDAV